MFEKSAAPIKVRRKNLEPSLAVPDPAEAVPHHVIKKEPQEPANERPRRFYEADFAMN